MGGGSTISLSKIYALVMIVGLGRVNGDDARGLRFGLWYSVPEIIRISVQSVTKLIR